MNILVTGLTGLAGSYVAEHLRRSGHGVTGISRRPNDRGSSPADPIATVIHRDLVSLAELPAGTDAVVHTAATRPMAGTSVRQLIRDNVIATDNLVRLSKDHGVRRFIFFSSLSVYGDVGTDVVDESTPIVNPEPYGMSKLFGECCLRECAPAMSSLSLRLPAVLGRGARRHWLATMVAKARANEALHIYNPDAPFNNAVHLGDLCAFIERWLQGDWRGFDAVTLGADGSMSIRDVVLRVASRTKCSSRIVEQSTSGRSFIVSSARAKDLYGYSPGSIGDVVDRYLTEECE